MPDHVILKCMNFKIVIHWSWYYEEKKLSCIYIFIYLSCEISIYQSLNLSVHHKFKMYMRIKSKLKVLLVIELPLCEYKWLNLYLISTSYYIISVHVVSNLNIKYSYTRKPINVTITMTATLIPYHMQDL